MNPRNILAHHLRSYRAQTGQSQGDLAKALGIGKDWLCRAENPDTYSQSGTRSAVPRVLDEMLDVLGLTFAPADDTVPTVAQIIELIDRMEASQGAKAVAMAAVHAAGLTRLT